MATSSKKNKEDGQKEFYKSIWREAQLYESSSFNVNLIKRKGCGLQSSLVCEDTHPGADLVQAGGDGFGRSVTAEHMTFQDPGVFIPRHISKVPEKMEKRKKKRNMRSGRSSCGAGSPLSAC